LLILNGQGQLVNIKKFFGGRSKGGAGKIILRVHSLLQDFFFNPGCEPSLDRSDAGATYTELRLYITASDSEPHNKATALTPSERSEREKFFYLS